MNYLLLQIARSSYFTNVCFVCYAIKDSVQDKIFSAVKELMQDYPDYKLIVTGHSLGGALSTICGTDLAILLPDVDVRVINFGAPRVGNEAFKELVESLPNLSITRLVHHMDVVPRTPMIGFKHVGHTIQVNANLADEVEADTVPKLWAWGNKNAPWKDWNLLFARSPGDHSAKNGYIPAVRNAIEAGVWVPSVVTEEP